MKIYKNYVQEQKLLESPQAQKSINKDNNSVINI